jgi:23S rRNA (uracil1939-C5)-methyltransferase
VPAQESNVNELVIDGMSTAGEGVGRLADGRVVFVRGAVLGDRVRVTLAERRHRVQYADVVELLDPSAVRTRGRCTVDACGGCPLKMITAEGQAEVKRRRVVDALRRIGGLDVDVHLATPTQVGDGWRYRHRVRLHAALNKGHQIQLGYFAAKTHSLVPLSSCPVLWRELEQATLALAAALESIPREAGISVVELAHSRRDNRTAAVITIRGDVQLFRSSLKWIDDAALSGVVVVGPDKRWQHGNVELRYDHGRAEEYTLKYEPDLFTQAFPEMNDRLVAAVVSAVRPSAGLKVLELHAGIGNFTVPLALAGARVIAVEQRRRSAILCRRNLCGAGLPEEVVAASDFEAMSRLGEADLVVMDPPRTGARGVVEVLAARGPARVVYVSCDSATLARDAQILTDGGYHLSHVEAFDMFPETPHVEVLAVFERADPVSP